MGSEFAEKSIAEWYVSLNMYTMIDDDINDKVIGLISEILPDQVNIMSCHAMSSKIM